LPAVVRALESVGHDPSRAERSEAVRAPVAERGRPAREPDDDPRLAEQPHLSGTVGHLGGGRDRVPPASERGRCVVEGQIEG